MRLYSPWPAILVALAYSALMLWGLASGSANAAVLEYHPEVEARQRTVIQLYVRTRRCLGTAGRAIMRQGIREALIVQHFMTRMCAEPLYAQLRRDGMSEEEARRLLVELTRKALYEDILDQPIPN